MVSRRQPQNFQLNSSPRYFIIVFPSQLFRTYNQAYEIGTNQGFTNEKIADRAIDLADIDAVARCFCLRQRVFTRPYDCVFVCVG